MAPKKAVVQQKRLIKANNKAFNSSFKYANNYISTSKYSLLTFVPKNLFEQFRRIANTYFLVLLILQLVPQISSLNPYTTIFPLIAVLTISAIKDAVDDWQRHQSDNKVNNRLSWVLKNESVVEDRWHKVSVGDIIRLNENHFVSADVLLLSTSEPNSLCYLETAELDGETNLKVKQALEVTGKMANDIDKLSKFNGEIECNPPSSNLASFEGILTYNGERYALNSSNVLLRGCVIRNTNWCFGLVIYTGKETKLMMNSGKTAFKRTATDKLLNILILGIFATLFFTCLFCSIGHALWESYSGYDFQTFLPWESFIPGSYLYKNNNNNNNTNTNDVTYAEGYNSSVFNGTSALLEDLPVLKDPWRGVIISSMLVFLSYFIVLNTLVPISLYVSVEMIRFGHSWWINWDKEMYYKANDTPARSRSTTLNEELGQIKYVFSDKTGTLTQNVMTFLKCSINGVIYGHTLDELKLAKERIKKVDFSENPMYETSFKFYDESLWTEVKKGNAHAHMIFRLLSLCHTVMIERADGNLEYKAQSPDEGALVSAARNFGFVFKDRTINSITIEVMGRTEVHELLAILDFNSVRKRMSVILKKDNRITLYCKGADCTVFDLCSRKKSAELVKTTNEHLSLFAQNGLRTLVCAFKEISPTAYNKWADKYKEASLSLDNRDEKVAAVYEEIERDMVLIGATAIEDKLQDGVPQTITNLMKADIKIWLLTGDKIETAINIGYSCGLLKDEMHDIFIIDHNTKHEVEEELKRSLDAVLNFDPAATAEFVLPSVYRRRSFGALSLHGSRSSLISPSRDALNNNNENNGGGGGVGGFSDDGVGSGGEGAGGSGENFNVSNANKKSPIVKISNISVDDDDEGEEGRLNGTDNGSDKLTVKFQCTDKPHQRQNSIIKRIKLLKARFFDNYDETDNNKNNTDEDTNGRNTQENDEKNYLFSNFTTYQSNTNELGTNNNAKVASEQNVNNNLYRKSILRSKKSLKNKFSAIKNSAASFHSTPNKEENVNKDASKSFAVVISGSSLLYALDKDLEGIFCRLGTLCSAVICCRVTPLQKALVVEMVKKREKAITLAIGDGANDVNMIRRAHIGVGLSGEEGMQAVLSSDFSLAQFRFLERLLLVHGRWSYLRMCKFLKYFFYKNFAFTFCHVWYAFFCAFSAQTLYDEAFISLYNICYTSLPIMALGIFEQDVNDSYSIAFPSLYTSGHKNLFFNKKKFASCVIEGLISSLVLFLVPFMIFNNAIKPNGQDLGGHKAFGTIVASSLIVTVTLRCALDTWFWTGFNHFVIWGSIVFYFAFTSIFYSELFDYTYLGTSENVMGSSLFFFTLILVVTILLLPVITVRFYNLMVNPSLTDMARCKQRQTKIRKTKRRFRPLIGLKHPKRQRTGYAFSHQEGYGDLIMSGLYIQPRSDAAVPRMTEAFKSLAIPGTAIVGIPFSNGNELMFNMTPGTSDDTSQLKSAEKGPKFFKILQVLRPKDKFEDQNTLQNFVGYFDTNTPSILQFDSETKAKQIRSRVDVGRDDVNNSESNSNENNSLLHSWTVDSGAVPEEETGGKGGKKKFWKKKGKKSKGVKIFFPGDPDAVPTIPPSSSLPSILISPFPSQTPTNPSSAHPIPHTSLHPSTSKFSNTSLATKQPHKKLKESANSTPLRAPSQPRTFLPPSHSFTRSNQPSTTHSSSLPPTTHFSNLLPTIHPSIYSTFKSSSQLLIPYSTASKLKPAVSSAAFPALSTGINTNASAGTPAVSGRSTMVVTTAGISRFAAFNPLTNVTMIKRITTNSISNETFSSSRDSVVKEIDITTLATSKPNY